MLAKMRNNDCDYRSIGLNELLASGSTTAVAYLHLYTHIYIYIYYIKQASGLMRGRGDEFLPGAPSSLFRLGLLFDSCGVAVGGGCVADVGYQARCAYVL